MQKIILEAFVQQNESFYTTSIENINVTYFQSAEVFSKQYCMPYSFLFSSVSWPLSNSCGMGIVSRKRNVALYVGQQNFQAAFLRYLAFKRHVNVHTLTRGVSNEIDEKSNGSFSRRQRHKGYLGQQSGRIKNDNQRIYEANHPQRGCKSNKQWQRNCPASCHVP